jgi:hypothetical protein
MSIKKLRDNHDEMIRLSDEITRKNKEFFVGLSRPENLRAYFKKAKALKTDEDRARFLCILAKQEFLAKGGIPKSYTVKIDKTIYDEDNKGKNWEVMLQFDTYKKQIEVYASYCNWDAIKVKYKFDLFSLYCDELLNDETKGETKYIPYEGSHGGPKPDTVVLNRSDNDIRIVIDCLFEHLRQKNLDKSHK